MKGRQALSTLKGASRLFVLPRLLALFFFPFLPPQRQKGGEEISFNGRQACISSMQLSQLDENKQYDVVAAPEKGAEVSQLFTGGKRDMQGPIPAHGLFDIRTNNVSRM